VQSESALEVAALELRTSNIKIKAVTMIHNEGALVRILVPCIRIIYYACLIIEDNQISRHGALCSMSRQFAPRLIIINADTWVLQYGYYKSLHLRG
jgi:hypothetical protein